MAITLTVTVDQAKGMVTLRVAGGVPDYVVTGSPAGDPPSYTVRTTWVQPAGATADVRVGVDGQMPLNADTVYQVKDSTGAILDASTVVRLTSASPLLSDATDPSRAQAVVVKSQPPSVFEARSVWWDILGTSSPFVSVAPLRRRNGDLVLYVGTRNERVGLIDLLRPGNPLMLRAACPDAVDDLVFLPLTATEDLVNVDKPAGPRTLTLTYQAVSPELGPYVTVPGRSYAAVLTEAATYGYLPTLYADYAALLTGIPSFTYGANLLSNGAFNSGGTGWSTFWTAAGVTWNFTGNTGKASTPPDTGAALIQPSDFYNLPTIGNRVYRVTGRVRCTASTPNAVKLELLSSDGTAVCDYFNPGTSVASTAILPATSAWAPFAAAVTTLPGAQTATLGFRADMSSGGTVEWDDLSVQQVLT